jgi:hypothetical protein
MLTDNESRGTDGENFSPVNSENLQGQNNSFRSIHHKDAYLVFRALCKLSMKGVSDEVVSIATSDPIAVQNK